MYSSFQYDIISDQLISSDAPGKLNTLYNYYLRYLKNGENIFIKLLSIKLNNNDTVNKIQELLENKDYTELETFLTREKSEPEFKVSDAEKILNAFNIVIISSYYFAFTNDNSRYEFLFNLYNNISENDEGIEKLAKFIYESNPTKNNTNILMKSNGAMISNSMNNDPILIKNSSDPATLNHLPQVPQATSRGQFE
jgi:hypothetical protein